MTYKDKNCLKCGVKYPPKSSTQKYCLVCRTINTKEYKKKWKKENPEKIKEINKRHYRKNKKSINKKTL